MMRIFFKFLTYLTVIGFPFSTTAQDLNTAISFSGSGDMRINKTALDAQGNIYSTGYFSGTVDFDSSPLSTANLSANSSSGDVFITKYSSSGIFQWVKQVGSSSIEVGKDIAIDSDGNIIVVGYFNGTLDMNPGSGTNNLFSSLNNDDLFVLKLDSAGNYVYAFKIGDADLQIPLALTLDTANNIIITGYFHGSVDFDPTPGGYAYLSNISSGSNTFIAKYTNAGSYVWAKNIGPLTSYEKGQDITSDELGNVYITGYFQSTTDFDPGAGVYNLTPTNSPNTFLLKLAWNGDFVWAKNMGGKQGYGVAVDNERSVYVYGDTWNTSDMDPGTGVYNLYTGTPTGYYCFLSKLDSLGNFQWSQIVSNFGITPLTNPNIYAIGVDHLNHVYLTGGFSSTFDFDSSTDSLKLTSNGGSIDVFVSKINKNGDLIWAINMGGSTTDQGTDISVQPNGNVVVSGHFTGTADFDPTAAGTFNLVSAGSNDGFIAIYNNGMFPLSLNAATLQAVIVEEGIELSWQNNYTSTDLYTTIQKSEDGIHFYSIGKISIEENKENFSFIDHNVIAGMNFYRLLEESIDGKITYSKIVSCNIKNSNSNLLIFPNPVGINQKIGLQLPVSITNKNIAVNIKDYNGHRVLSQHLSSIHTKNGIYYLDPNQILKEGIYFVEVICGNQSFCSSFEVR